MAGSGCCEVGSEASGQRLGQDRRLTWRFRNARLEAWAEPAAGLGSPEGLGGVPEAELIRVKRPSESHRKGQSGSPGPNKQERGSGRRAELEPGSAEGVRRARPRPARQRGGRGSQAPWSGLCRPRECWTSGLHCGAGPCPARQSAASPASAHWMSAAPRPIAVTIGNVFRHC